MNESGERLVFEAKASRWALPTERALAGLLCLLGLGLVALLVGEGVLFWNLADFMPLWFSVTFPALLVALALPFGAVAAMRAGTRRWKEASSLRAGMRIALDEEGLHLQAPRSKTLDLPWQQLVAVRAFEAAPVPQRRVLSLKLYTSEGSLFLHHRLQGKESLLDELVTRGGFIKTRAGSIWDIYSRKAPEEAGTLRLESHALRWTQPGEEGKVAARKRRLWRAAGLYLTLAALGAIPLAILGRTSPTTVLTPTTRLVPLGGDCCVQGVAWRPDSSAVAVLFSRSQTGPDDMALLRKRLVLVSKAGALSYLTGWMTRIHEPAWSPDGKWLACVRKRYTLSEAEQQTLDTLERRKRAITDNTLREAPSGEIILPNVPPPSSKELKLRSKQDAEELWLLQPGSKTERVLTPEGFDVSLRAPSWAPSGKRIAAIYQREETGQDDERGLWVARVGEGPQTGRCLDLPEGCAMETLAKPIWAPDESALLVLGYKRDPTASAGKTTVVQLLLDLKSGEWRVIPISTYDSEWEISGTHWTADSSVVAYVVASIRGLRLEHINVASGERTKPVRWVSPLPWVLLQVQDWSPSGKSALVRALAWNTLFTGGNAVFFLATKSGRLVRMVQPTEVWSGLRWSPDGQHIAAPARDKVLFVKVPEGVW